MFGSSSQVDWVPTLFVNKFTLIYVVSSADVLEVYIANIVDRDQTSPNRPDGSGSISLA